MSKRIARAAAVGVAAGGLLVAGAASASAADGTIGDRDAMISKCAGTAGCTHDYTGSDSRFRVDNLQFTSGLLQVWRTDTYFGTVTFDYYNQWSKDNPSTNSKPKPKGQPN